MRLCKDCKHSAPCPDDISGVLVCQRVGYVDPVTGDVTHPYCSDQRSFMWWLNCGFNGRHWEGKL